MNPEEIIRKMWSSNAFMNVLKIEIKEVHCGGATLVMPIDFDIHTNHWLGVAWRCHGSAGRLRNRYYLCLCRQNLYNAEYEY